jgi:hypothetical protein
MSSLTPAQRLKFLEKARAKKAQPEEKVDVLSQLVVVEGDKKKRKADPGRVSVPIPDKAPSSTTAGADETAEGEGESHLKSPVKKRVKSLARKDKKDKDALVMEKVQKETESVAVETALVEATEEGSSPWDPLFNPEVFLERMVDMAGNSSRFHSTSTDELLKMALGHELKGLLLNYALAARQRSEIATAKEKEALVGKTLTSLEEDLAATKEKLTGEVETLKKSCEEEVSKLVKAHEEELAKVKKDHEAALKMTKILQEGLTAKDERIATLAKEN